MSSFTRGAYWPTDEVNAGGHRIYEFVEGFRFYLGGPGSPWWVEVPTGRRSDLASVPRRARSFIREDRMIKAGGVHDECRRNPRIPLWLADLVFLHAMWVERTPVFDMVVAFIAVRFNSRRD